MNKNAVKSKKIPSTLKTHNFPTARPGYPKMPSSRYPELYTKAKRPVSRHHKNSRNLINNSMRNFETQHVTIDLKDMDKSTFQSTHTRGENEHTPKKSNSSKIVKHKNKKRFTKFSKTPKQPEHPYTKIDSRPYKSNERVSPRKFLEQQNSYKREDLKIEVESTAVKDSPIKQYIYDSLRSNKPPSHIFNKKNNESEIQRNFSKESDMCKPVSWNESTEDPTQNQRISIEEKIDHWARLANESNNDNLDIRQELFKAFGADKEYFMSKRRGAVKEDSVDYGQNNRILHIRQAWDPNKEITPTSSIKTSEFSKLNRLEDSEVSSDRNQLDSFRNIPVEEISPLERYQLETPKKRSSSPRVQQKVLDCLRGNFKDSHLYHSNSVKKLQKKESFDIISKAREACDQYLRQVDQQSWDQQVVRLENPNDEEEVKEFCNKSNTNNNLEPYLEPASLQGDSRRSRYQDYLQTDEDPWSSEKKSYLKPEYVEKIFDTQKVPDQTEERGPNNMKL